MFAHHKRRQMAYLNVHVLAAKLIARLDFKFFLYDSNTILFISVMSFHKTNLSIKLY